MVRIIIRVSCHFHSNRSAGESHGAQLLVNFIRKSGAPVRLLTITFPAHKPPELRSVKFSNSNPQLLMMFINMIYGREPRIPLDIQNPEAQKAFE